MIISFEELPKVALEDMNNIHQTELDILNSLYDATVKGDNFEEIDRLLNEFIEDVEKHFSFEQELMEKYNFFAYPMHRGEHDRVRMELSQLKKEWDKNKNPDLIKAYIENHFVPWLINHVQTMDTVTAMFLSNFIR